jgi:hypothetical protein
MERCLFCGQIVQMIWVHGHYQCARCHQITVPCCDGETAANSKPSERGQTTRTPAVYPGD